MRLLYNTLRRNSLSRRKVQPQHADHWQDKKGVNEFHPPSPTCVVMFHHAGGTRQKASLHFHYSMAQTRTRQNFVMVLFHLADPMPCWISSIARTNWRRLRRKRINYALKNIESWRSMKWSIVCCHSWMNLSHASKNPYPSWFNEQRKARRLITNSRSRIGEWASSADSWRDKWDCCRWSAVSSEHSLSITSHEESEAKSQSIVSHEERWS